MTQWNRIGRFTIDHEHIDDNPEIVRAIMGTLIVVRAESLFANSCIEYIALCDDFEAMDPGTMPPFYDVVVDGEQGTITWSKVV
jgi:hypothetical protein